MSSQRLPETTAHVRILRQSWQQGQIEGEVGANQFEWQFQWYFRQPEQPHTFLNGLYMVYFNIKNTSLEDFYSQ